MQLDGIIQGTLKSEQGVVISCSGRLKGEVWADRIIVNGQIDGTCHANVIEILNQGVVKGDIYCDNLSIDQGGKFLGTTHPGESQQVVAIRTKGASSQGDNSKSDAETEGKNTRAEKDSRKIAQKG